MLFGSDSLGFEKQICFNYFFIIYLNKINLKNNNCKTSTFHNLCFFYFTKCKILECFKNNTLIQCNFVLNYVSYVKIEVSSFPSRWEQQNGGHFNKNTSIIFMEKNTYKL